MVDRLRLARRVVVLLFGAVALLMGAAAPASAEEVPVAGSFTATGNFLFQCEFAQEFLDGEGDWTGLGAVTMDFTFCVALPASGDLNDPWPITQGSFTITGADGTVTGGITGFVMAGTANPEGLFPGHMTFTVTGGTGRFEAATGAIEADTLSRYVPPFSREMSGTVSGSITLPASTPSTKDDCKDDGWRNFTDENGTPFKNQGECIAWVIANT